MNCDLCRGISHPPQCPNFTPITARRLCSVCGEGICAGEEYVENDEGEAIHYDCIYSIKDLLLWLGYKVKTMEDHKWD